jgi:hypothetical protein
MIGVFRPRPTAFVHDWFTPSGGRQVADSKAENKTHTSCWSGRARRRTGLTSLARSRDPGASPSAQCPAAEVTQAADLRQHRYRDSVYGEVFIRRLRAMGIRDRPTAGQGIMPRSLLTRASFQWVGRRPDHSSPTERVIRSLSIVCSRWGQRACTHRHLRSGM